MTMPREYHREYAKNYYKAKLASFIKQLGGKCFKCGSRDNLHFDHINPKTKLFNISCFNSHSKIAITNELNKCQLLCEPCHIKKSKTDGSQLNRAKGSQVSTSKLTEKNVRLIKKSLDQGVSIVLLAEKYGCTKGNISAIKQGKIWKHV